MLPDQLGDRLPWSPDYPAAHSTDSCWFAVDRDGRVGFFDTGEAGAMPEQGLFGPAAERTRVRIGRLVPEGETIFDLRGYVLPYLRPNLLQHWGGPTDFPLLMFLDSLEPVSAAITSGLARELRARHGVAVLWDRLPPEDHQRLHLEEDSPCRGCFWPLYRLDEPAEEGTDPNYNLARHGLYVFKALGGNATSNPYGLQEAPIHPVHVDQLPPDLRTQIKAVQFADLSFAQTPVFQPAEHVPCSLYDGTYADMHGRIHGFDVDEDEDRQWIDNLLDTDGDETGQQGEEIPF
jgi:hypothetical protein